LLNCQGANAPALLGCAYVDTYEGCCLGEKIVWCDDGNTYCIDCDGSPSCGWKAAEAIYDCGTDGEQEPSGMFIKQCEGGGGCAPDCAGKECGPDGCGGACGLCQNEWETCSGGSCVAPCGDLTSKWTWYELSIFDGPCWGDDWGANAGEGALMLEQEDGEYVLQDVDLKPDEPDFHSYVECVFSIDECKLQCSCDSDCLSQYYSDYEEYSGQPLDEPWGTVSLELVFAGDGTVQLYYWQAIYADGDSCIKEAYSYSPGDGTQCSPCQAYEDCSAYYVCTDYANFEGNAFCTAQCTQDPECPSGFECSVSGECWTPQDPPALCMEGDPWFEDPCANIVGPWDLCSPTELCSDGLCDDAAQGKIGSPCDSDADCLAGTAALCLTEPDNGFPGGYCTSFCNSNGAGPCPAGSTCFSIPAENYKLCFDDCLFTNDCRGSYFCDQDWTCFPE